MNKETNMVILDTKTGKQIKIKSECDGFYWAEGNGSCDCNRELFFDQDTNQGYCLGEQRYLIIESDYDNYTLNELNDGYPEELKVRYLKNI